MSLVTITKEGAFDHDIRTAINQNFKSVQFVTQGDIWWVRPRTGSDGADGKSSQTAFKTLVAALAAATANQNDIVLLCAEGNTASDTTDYQNAQLDWSKNSVHLIGVNAGSQVGMRSRVAFLSTYAAATNLFKVSANGCQIANIEFFAGVASVLPTGCLEVTGQRNHFINCQISGMGNAANDIAGAYSLFLNAGAENTFDGCYIGLDTVTLGAAANSQIKCAAQATRNLFRDCTVMTYTNHATNNNFLRAPTGSLDRWIRFDNTVFVNPIDSASTGLTQAFIVASDAGGSVILAGGGTGILGATDWNSTDSGNVRAMNGTVTAATFGLAVAVLR